LVEIAPNANPPVAKIIDFKKFKYLEAKKQRQDKKRAQEVEVKQVRLRPFIADNDFEVRALQAEKFLKSGNRLKIVVKFQGREFTRKEFGYNIIARFGQRLESLGEMQGTPRWEGKVLTAFIIPLKKVYGKNKN
jgi:translation initiation factor IF-3